MNKSHRVVFKRDSSETTLTDADSVTVYSLKWPLRHDRDINGRFTFNIDLSKTPNVHKCLTALELEVDNGVNKTVLYFNESNITIRSGGEVENIEHSLKLPKFNIYIFFEEKRVGAIIGEENYPFTTKNGFRSEVQCTVRTSSDCRWTNVSHIHDFGTVREKTKVRVDDILPQTFRVVLVVLFPMAVIATVPTVILAWIEAIEKRRYQLAKDKPVKLKLTREYLAKLRPSKKGVKHSAAHDAGAAKDAK